MQVAHKEKEGERLVFMAAACVAIIAVILICVFIFANGVPAIITIGIRSFIFGTKWKPELEIFGIFPMLISSIIVTILAVIIGTSVALCAAVFMTRFCNKKVRFIMQSAIDLLAGIPSVVYGFIGLELLVPRIANISGNSGACLFSAVLVLSVMILPTICSISMVSLDSVDPLYLEGSLSLGVCKERGVLLEVRAAKSGILAGIILGLSRAIGETMAVIMLSGNQPIMPRGLFYGARTLTANIALEMGYATGLHRSALVATALVLFILIMLVNVALLTVQNKKREA